jgi:16S rRNA (cytosine1402-N4)-methyltransferase
MRLADGEEKRDLSAGHAPVLPQEVLQALSPRPNDVYVDLTAGRGGHAVRVAKVVGPTGRVVLFDLDQSNLAFAGDRVREATSVTTESIHASFASVARELNALGLTADLVLADLGFASTQVDDPARGLSFMRDGPLDMRLDASSGMTAAEFVASASERDLGEVIARFGEEPLARKIAAKIVAARAVSPISTTAQLADLVREAYGSRARTSRLHPATKTFQALRIAVNDELGALSALLDAISTAARRIAEGRPTWLRPGARVAIIGFHSLEDRLVKQCFAEMCKSGLADEITDGPVVSSEAESAENPRARSAKLRAVTVGRAHHSNSDSNCDSNCDVKTA